MMKYRYVLDENHNAVVCNDPAEWSKSFAADRHVADVEIATVRISTVFLGIDLDYDGPPPLLFETMIFGGSLDGYQTRCSTWEQAEQQHAAAVALVRWSDNPPAPKR
jgi:hypothetical protein